MQIKKSLKIVTIILVVFSVYSCNYNSSVMMKTPKGYKFDAPPSDSLSEYVISVSDIIEFQLYTNDGTALVDLTAISEKITQGTQLTSTSYLVEYDGFCNLPIIGRVKLQGKTIREAQTFLEEEYSKYYIKPFVLLKVTNRRVTVFPGGSSKAKVITLTNENTTLIEALGQVGGLSTESIARKIKLIRGDLKNPKVYLFDFSTLEGVKKSDFVLQANDIIYVQAKNNALREWIRDVAPVISLITSTITLIVVINNLKKP